MCVCVSKISCEVNSISFYPVDIAPARENVCFRAVDCWQLLLVPFVLALFHSINCIQRMIPSSS